MNTHAVKTLENKSQAVTNNSPKQQINSKPTFQFVDNRPEAITQREQKEAINNSPRIQQSKSYQEMANNSRKGKQLAQLQATASAVVQRTDLFDFDVDHTKKEGGPLEILEKTGDGYPFTDDFLVEKIQLRGGRSAAHSEVFCIIFRSRYNKGVFRFSRNQGGDTFQRQAQLDKSNWPVVAEKDVLPKGLKVAKAVLLALQVHNSMTHYISGDCHDFADMLFSALSNGSLPTTKSEQKSNDDLGW
jgi:hypothetical protein